jgi:hypothetical protein
MMFPMSQIAHKADVVLRAYRRYMESNREYNKVVERCSLKGWPDRKVALRNAFKLQALLYDQQELRLDHLTNAFDPKDAVWKSFTSVSAIFKRLNEDWSDAEEEALKRSSPSYTVLLTAIKECQSLMDPDALDGPFLAAQRDPEYRAAGAAHYDVLQELNDELAK